MKALNAASKSPVIRAIAALYAAALLLAFPPALSWLVAAGLLAFALRQFRLMFAASAAAKPTSSPSADVALTAPRETTPSFDVEAALRAAQSARPLPDAR
jgi:hypothetical protein